MSDPICLGDSWLIVTSCLATRHANRGESPGKTLGPAYKALMPMANNPNS